MVQLKVIFNYLEVWYVQNLFSFLELLDYKPLLDSSVSTSLAAIKKFLK